MITIFWILGWVMWNGIAFFILKWLNEQYDKCIDMKERLYVVCDRKASYLQFLAALACLIAMSVIGITAILAIFSLLIDDNEP